MSSKRISQLPVLTTGVSGNQYLPISVSGVSGYTNYRFGVSALASAIHGDSGVTGATGVSGISGVTGVTGIAGGVGSTGVTGVSGISGVTGVTGSAGGVGVTGKTGVSGVSGVTGVTGAGVTGVTGPAPTGASGDVVFLTASQVAGVDTGVFNYQSSALKIPKIIGGTSTTQPLSYQTTTGIGASGADHIFLVGNNGATEAMRITNASVTAVQSAGGQFYTDATFIVRNTSTPTKGLYCWYNVTDSAGHISSVNQGVAFTKLALQSSGLGGIGIGRIPSGDYPCEINTNGGTNTRQIVIRELSSQSQICAANSPLTVYLPLMVDGSSLLLNTSSSGSVVIGSAALATNATDGFLYIPSCAGTPTGTPTTYTGRTPIVYDTSNNKIYVYNGAWKSVTLS